MGVVRGNDEHVRGRNAERWEGEGKRESVDRYRAN